MSLTKYNPIEYLHNGKTYKTDLYECNNGLWVRHEDCADLEAENAALKEESERLKARVAEPEKEDTLWAMLDAIEKALFKKAAPHAWETVVTSAGVEFITSRRKTKEPTNES